MPSLKHIPISLALVAIPHLAAAAADPAPLVIDGDVPADGPEHFFVPFDVPEGIEEIEIRHDDGSEENILDFGLDDPDGYRGWGGGTTEAAIVGRLAASRAYVRGPIRAGKWKVVVGKAKVEQSPARYHIEIVLRTAPTLAEQKQRTPYAPPPPRTDRRYYAGDFHVHSLESTDAAPSLDVIATYAESRQLDFVEISDHNTITQMEFFADARTRHPNLLFVPGIEYTTYHGHANAIGATRWVDHKIGQPGVTINGAADAILGQGALFSINHPVLDLGNCIGCAWKQDVDPNKISAVEIETGGLQHGGLLFIDKAIAFWDDLCAKGHHVAALGGSDSHHGGETTEPTWSPISAPTTLVLSDGLSSAALLDGIRNGRTVVKLQGMGDPMIELTSSVEARGDTVQARSTILSAKITGGLAEKSVSVYFVKNGVDQAAVPVTSDPFVHEARVVAPEAGEDRWRVEVAVGDRRRTITSHVFVQRDANGPDPVAAGGGDDGGCHASKVKTPSELAWGFALGVAALFARRLLLAHRRRMSR